MRPIQESQPIRQPGRGTISSLVTPALKFDSIDGREHDGAALSILAVNEDSTRLREFSLHRRNKNQNFLLARVDRSW
jgi:hypothetical protein